MSLALPVNDLTQAYVEMPYATNFIYYFTIISISKVSSQTITIYESESSATIQLADGVDFVVPINIMNNMYFSIDVPGTSSYKWMRLTFYTFPGLDIYVRHGEKPTRGNFDWVYRTPNNQTDVDYSHLFIPATSTDFNAGTFYALAYNGNNYDGTILLKYSLFSWRPRFI